MIDAPGLVEEDVERAHSGLSFQRWAASNRGGPIAFIEESAASQSLLCVISKQCIVLTDSAGQADTMPVVLLTHIPLARPDTAPCGPLREHGTIRQGTGYGYENTLSARTSQLLLESLRPIVVFRYVGLIYRTST